MVQIGCGFYLIFVNKVLKITILFLLLFSRSLTWEVILNNETFNSRNVPQVFFALILISATNIEPAALSDRMLWQTWWRYRVLFVHLEATPYVWVWAGLVNRAWQDCPPSLPATRRSRSHLPGIYTFIARMQHRLVLHCCT